MRIFSLHKAWEAVQPAVLLLPFPAELRCYFCGGECEQKAPGLRCMNPRCGAIGEFWSPKPGLTNTTWSKAS